MKYIPSSNFFFYYFKFYEQGQLFFVVEFILSLQCKHCKCTFNEAVLGSWIMLSFKLVLVNLHYVLILKLTICCPPSCKDTIAVCVVSLDLQLLVISDLHSKRWKSRIFWDHIFREIFRNHCFWNKWGQTKLGIYW